MIIEVDAINLNVSIQADEHLEYEGHLIDVSTQDGITLRCRACGEMEHVDVEPTGLHVWEVICYILNRFDECSGDVANMRQRIDRILNKYVGQPTDDHTMQALEEEIRDEFGDDFPVNIYAK